MLYPSGLTAGDAGANGIMLVWFANFFSIGIGMGILKIFLCISLPAIVFIINKGGQRDYKFIGL